MTDDRRDVSPPPHEALREFPSVEPDQPGITRDLGLSRRFWRWQAVVWGGTALIGVALHGRQSLGEFVFHLLFPATGLAFTSWMARALRRRALIPGSLRPLLVWSAKHVMISAVLGGVINLLLHRFVLAEPVLAFPRVAVEYLLSAAGWALVFGVWLFAFGLRDVFLATARAVEAQQRMEASVREAEARALRAQLDPHFLFNAINGARALIGPDPDGARDMLSRYAEVLRYATTRGRGLRVLLGDELAAVESYLEVERQRFRNRMLVHIDVAAVHRQVTIPPMLLQTLAENAVRHGVSRLRQGGTVSIVAEPQGHCLQLHITNPAPFSPTPSTDVVSGIGLQNSRDRLHLLHGDAASLRVARTLDQDGSVEHWTVTVTLPIGLGAHEVADG